MSVESASDLPDAQSVTSDDAGGERYYRIDEVARRTQLTKRTLRYYEELGLLAPAQRSEGNYRLYSEADIRTIEHIKAMRDFLGLNLKEIREMVAAELERDRARERWHTESDPHMRSQALDDAERITRRELDMLQEKLAGLEVMRQSLLERLQVYDRLRNEARAALGSQGEQATRG